MEKKKKEKVTHSRVSRLCRLAEDVEQRLQNFSHGRLDALVGSALCLTLGLLKNKQIKKTLNKKNQSHWRTHP